MKSLRSQSSFTGAIDFSISDCSVYLLMASQVEPYEVLFRSRRSRIILCKDGQQPHLLKATKVYADGVERLWREINLCLEIMSPFVVHSDGWLPSRDNEIFLRLEYLPGGDLDLLLDRQGSMAPAAARFYVGCAALGLEALHDLAVVHRDVKPDNLGIAMDGYVKLIDLGFARHLPDGGRGRAQTLLGTPEYLAPEAFLGEGQDARSDLWSLGVTLYVLLLDSHPHGPSSTPQELYRQILDAPPFWPQNIISDSAKAFVHSCMQRAPERRPTARTLWGAAFFTGPPAPLSAETGALRREALLARSHPAPFVPRLRQGPFDTTYFEECASSDDDDDDDDDEGEGDGDGDGEGDGERRRMDGAARGGASSQQSAAPPALLVQQPGGETSAAVVATRMATSFPAGCVPGLQAGASSLRAARRKEARNRELSLPAHAACLQNYRTSPCGSVDELFQDV